MSFLSIAFLAALPLAAAPILLHFFDRRRNVVIEWGAMQFLQEAATRRTSARRMKHFLLLLLRVAAVAALVTALARPLLPGHWFGAGGRGETILVLDNSLSTARDAGGETLFRKLVAQAERMLDELNTGDSVRVLTASPYPAWATPGGVRVNIGSRAKLVEILQELRPTHAASDLLASLFTAVQSDADPMLQERRIVLLTDGQGSDWKTRDVSGWTRLRDLLQNAAVPTRLDVVYPDVDSVPTNNIAVTHVRTNRTVVGVDQPFTLTAEIENQSSQDHPGCTVTWLVGRERREESPLETLGAGESLNVLWRHSFDRTGVYTVTCQLDAKDSLPHDDRAAVVVEVVERIPILLIDGKAGLAEMQQDAYFVQAALGRSDDGEANDWQAVYEPRTVAPGRLETVNLQEYRAVVVPNLTRLSQRAVERLTEFVSDGGGLWVALGPRTDIRSFNRHFFKHGDGLSPLALDQIVTETDDNSRPPTINPFVADHPATAELANHERLDLADVEVARRFRFSMHKSRQNVSVLLELTNGQPLAVEQYVGRGRVIVQAVPLCLQWSKLALSQAFVVMVHDWLSYLTQPRATRHNLSPGDPISVHIAEADHDKATLTTPRGEDIELTAEPAGEGSLFRTSRTHLPGDYSLELGFSGDRIPFHVARDPAESDLKELTAADRQLLADAIGLERDSVSAGLSGTAQRQPVWPALLMILVLLMAGELLLSGNIARERFGEDPIAESTEAWQEASVDGLRGGQSTADRDSKTVERNAPGGSASVEREVEKVSR